MLLFSRFYSNWDVSARGFRLVYESIPIPCGPETKFDAENGQLSSLRYPFNYVGNPDCIYKISLKNGTFVKISVLDIQLRKTDNCSVSFVEIRDGKLNTSKLLNKLCGSISDVPRTIQSSGPDVWIR